MRQFVIIIFQFIEFIYIMFKVFSDHSYWIIGKYAWFDSYINMCVEQNLKKNVRKHYVKL